jgi:hypothetical protein
MENRDLSAYLRGKKTLAEVSYGSPGPGLPPMWTGRQERLSQSWMDIVVRLEAVALDVLDISEDIYYECLPLLKDVRGASSEMVHEQLSRFHGLLAILNRHAGDHAQMPAQVSRMQQLCTELQYVCDEISPRDPKVPEAPPRKKEDWAFQTLGKKKPDVTFTAPGGSDQWESTLQGHLTGKALPETSGSSEPSLVMASLSRAADSVAEATGDVEARFLRAGESIRLAMEAYTEVESVDVSISGAVPGSFPRLEIVARWRLSETSGRCSLYWIEDGKKRGMYVEGLRDDEILMSENLSDAQVASRVYRCFDSVLDFRPLAVRSGIVETLYRMAERAKAGLDVTPTHVEQVLAGLCPVLALSESVRLPADAVQLRTESIGAAVWSWFYDWEYEEDREYGDNRELVTVAKELETADSPGLVEGTLSGAFRSPRLQINMIEATVSIASEPDDVEILPRGMTDEDVSARLLSMSWQKENVTRGKVIESEWERGLLQSLGEDVEFTPAEHPRNLQTGEFVDAGSANPGQRKAAANASRRKKRATPPGLRAPRPTAPEGSTKKPKDQRRPSAELSLSDWDPHPPTKAPEVPAQEPEAPPSSMATTMDPLGNTVTQTPPVPDKITPPQPIMDPMGNVLGYAPVAPVLPPPPTMRQSLPPKKGKEMDFDTPLAEPKKGSQSPDLPSPPPGRKDLKKLTIPRDRTGMSTHEVPPEPSDEEKKKNKPQPVIPQPPKGGGVRRKNPDLDAAFGFAPPAGEAPPEAPAAPKSAPTAPPAPVPGEEKTTEQAAAAAVQSDPELQGASQGLDMGSSSDETMQQLAQLVQEMVAAFQATLAPRDGSTPVDPEAALKAFQAQRGEELRTAAGRAARKAYARDLVKAKKQVDGLSPEKAPKSPQERLDMIRSIAAKRGEDREKFWATASEKVDAFFRNVVLGSTQWSVDTLIDVTDDIETSQPGGI